MKEIRLKKKEPVESNFWVSKKLNENKVDLFIINNIFFIENLFDIFNKKLFLIVSLIFNLLIIKRIIVENNIECS